MRRSKLDRRHLLQERKSKLSSVYENIVRVRLLAVFSIIFVAATGFYFAQNSGRMEGGEIALPKLIWLSYAVLFWFCLPVLLIMDKRIRPGWRKIYVLFLVNMLFRAVIELLMMYVYRNWSPYYGIAHDVFSIALLGSLLLVYRNELKPDIFFGFAVTVLCMLLVEIVFVLYMLANVVESGTTIYFVPNGDGHADILNITWLVVLVLTAYVYIFTRRWLRGEFIRTGS